MNNQGNNQDKKREIGYNPNTVNFLPDTVRGVIDSDGTITSRIRRRTEYKRLLYECSVRISQQSSNIDLLKSLQHTLQHGQLYNSIKEEYQEEKNVKKQLEDEKKKKRNAAVLVLELNSNKGLSFLQNYLVQVGLKQPGKYRDSLIVRKIAEHKEMNYQPFPELTKQTNVTLKGIEISTAEILELTSHDKYIASQIAMAYLNLCKGATVEKPYKEKKRLYSLVEKTIFELEPSKNALCVGRKLSKYFYIQIAQKRRDLEKKLADPNFSLTGDYIVGLTIGDGSISFSININSKFEWEPEFTIVACRGDKLILDAVKRFFGGKGSIYKSNKKGTAYIYKITSVPVIKDSIIPLFENYRLSYSKQCQFEIIKEAVNLFQNQEYTKSQGLIKIINLYYEINTFHKKGRRCSKEEMLNKGLKYLIKRAERTKNLENRESISSITKSFDEAS